MRTNLDIIADAGGPTKMAAAITDAFTGVSPEPITVEPGIVAAWKRENSIPSAYWNRIVEARLATLDELAAAAEMRKFPDLAAERVAARSEGAAA